LHSQAAIKLALNGLDAAQLPLVEKSLSTQRRKGAKKTPVFRLCAFASKTTVKTR